MPPANPIWTHFNKLGQKQNRLTPDCILKLVYIYSNYKLQTPQKTSVWKRFFNKILSNSSDSLNGDNIEFIENDMQNQNENEEGNEEFDDFYDSDVTY
nr:14850_t:CDS:2 [Entrophospora candida]